MYDFLLTGIGANGKRETLCIQAETAQDAHSQFASMGYRDITLHTDDSAAAATRLTALDTGHVSPADMVELRGTSDLGFFLFLLKKLYRLGWWLAIPAILLLLAGWWASGAIGAIFILIAFGLAALPLALALWTALTGNSRKYEKMLEAACWGRWPEVLKRLPALRGHVPDFELDVHTACALTGMGQFEEGLATLQPHADRSDCPQWMYLARLAQVYDTAHRYEEGLDCYQRAYESEPCNPTLMLELAMALLKNERDTARAMELIHSAEQQQLSDVLLLLLPHVKGLAALNWGNPGEAEQYFHTAEENLRPMAPAAAMVRLVMDVNRAYRAIALAELGRLREAEALFAMARPRLEALKSGRILDRWNRVTRRG
ncbi:MAG: hypothetical protein IT365_06865 [Candidatus Hydrogenedentes bacterium]|nr:hypothetical protein [Candidatus Hydrogenedentota bacterium]